MANKEPKTREEKNLTKEAIKDPIRALKPMGGRSRSIDDVDKALGGKRKKGKTR